ncbi:hypothetical protein ASG81_13650 [Paenibacillus sp. Soil522]|nr:hypothetical protein ASG81_13650 [Paenibacillus sp. Soil522]
MSVSVTGLKIFSDKYNWHCSHCQHAVKHMRRIGLPHLHKFSKQITDNKNRAAYFPDYGEYTLKPVGNDGGCEKSIFFQ